MGHQYISNYDVVVKAAYSNECSKNLQHMFRRWVPSTSQSSGGSQKSTNTQDLVKELLSSSASTSKVSFLSFFMLGD